MKIDTLTDVHLAYEMAGKKARASESYHRALRAAFTNMDPRVHMTDTVLEHFNEVRTHKHVYLPKPASQIRLRARMLTAATKSGDVTQHHIHDVCDVQLKACEFYESANSRPVDCLVLARTLGELIYELCKFVNKELSPQENGTRKNIVHLRDVAHTINVAHPEDPEFRAAKAELIKLSDYFDIEDHDAQDD